jgi:hypothetical protein
MGSGHLSEKTQLAETRREIAGGDALSSCFPLLCYDMIILHGNAGRKAEAARGLGKTPRIYGEDFVITALGATYRRGGESYARPAT